ncbi:hypothetical protein BH18THE2_BH18THE2_11460 [soil metagenome]
MKKDTDENSIDNDNIDNDNDNNKVDIIIVLDKVSNLDNICKKYNEQQGTDIPPKEYKLMLIDSAISA